MADEILTRTRTLQSLATKLRVWLAARDVQLEGSNGVGVFLVSTRDTSAYVRVDANRPKIEWPDA